MSNSIDIFIGCLINGDVIQLSYRSQDNAFLNRFMFFFLAMLRFNAVAKQPLIFQFIPVANSFQDSRPWLVLQTRQADRRSSLLMKVYILGLLWQYRT